MIEQTIFALSEPKRREMLRLIGDSEMTSSEIAAHFAITAPAVSQHLKVLEQTGLVTVRRSGTKRYYQTRKEGLAELKQYIDRFWEDSLLMLKEAAEEEQNRP